MRLTFRQDRKPFDYWDNKRGRLPGTGLCTTDDVPAVTGQLKQSPDHFEVEELPAYAPSGQGEHLYLWIEKRDLNTQDAVARLARTLGVRPDAAGYAGLKDRKARTRQWVSFHHPHTPDPASLASEGIAVLEVSRHANKLRTGHLRGNRFTVRLAGVPASHDAHADAALALLAAQGLPNYFGDQRFGREGQNLAAAYAWIVQGGRPPGPPFLRKLYVSTLQSALFNAWLAERITRGALGRAIAGDVLRKEETGGLFQCEAPEVDDPRVAAWEISATGPMFGARMRAADADEHAHELRVLAAAEVTSEHLEGVKRYGEGTRRPARVPVQHTSVARDGDDLVLSFALPKGSYATVLISELTKTQGVTLGDAS